MTSKTTTKATRNNSAEKSRKTPRKHSLKHSVKNTNRINRQRRLQKQLQILLLERHSRRCIICHHPEREAIEEEFVHWRAPWKLSQDYKLADYRTVYRHARAVGLLLQRRERLHSALDAFVESVDDVTFTGDTILRATRAYSCIDSHGRWTEIPTPVQFSTSHDGPPPQAPAPHSNNSSTAASDILDIIPKYSNHASRSDATACAAAPAQASSDVDSDDDPDDDPEDDTDNSPDDQSEEDGDNVLEEHVTALSTSSKSTSRSNATACLPRDSRGAGSPAQAFHASDLHEDLDDDPEDDPDDNPHDNDRKEKPEANSLEETTTCAALPRPSRGPHAQTVSAVALNSHNRGRSVTATARAATSKPRSHSDTAAHTRSTSSNRCRAAMPPLALFHPRKFCRETFFAARIRMTGRRPTAPIA